MNTKICPRCRQSFECRHDDIVSCGCSTIHLTTEMQNYIKENYEECLCVNCLKDIEEGFHAMVVNPKMEKLS